MLERTQSRRETLIAVDLEPEGLGRRLQAFFDGVTGAPAPDRLTKLANELEAAFERGDLRKVS